MDAPWMVRQIFLLAILASLSLGFLGDSALGEDDHNRRLQRVEKLDPNKVQDWKIRWERHILSEVRSGYCERENGEEIGWLISPFLRGFYFGYQATGDQKWVRLLIACADAWIRRAVIEPDGYPGWPKVGAAGTPVDHLDDFYADSLLGEAMALRPLMLMAIQIHHTPALSALYEAKAENYIKLSKRLFEKWDKRGAWRETTGGGKMSVVLPFGVDLANNAWSEGYGSRNAPGNGHSHPNNKANMVALWLLAMFDATNDSMYRDYAKAWFTLMKSRLSVNDDGTTYTIWNYWQPAGPWDFKDGRPKHWIGVHPNAGYYDIDVEGMVTAYEHGLIFTEKDIDRLIATALREQRYWHALAPYNSDIQHNFVNTNEPDSWAGMYFTPWYLSLQAH
jgi:hypothetical protein